MVYTLDIIMALPPDNYICNIMYIIDYMYVGILPQPTNKEIINNLT